MITDIQPLVPSPFPQDLEKKAFELSQKAAELRGAIHPISAAELGKLVRVINCYYSNLIEGNRTTLRELEEVRKKQSSKDRVSLSEALFTASSKIHQQVSEERIDPFSDELIKNAHFLFYEKLEKRHLNINDKNGRKAATLIPGAFREQDVDVGAHLPPSHEYVGDYLRVWRHTYKKLSPIRQIALMGAIHHRLVWIHPFLDGNGRVSRIISDVLMSHMGLELGGLWCLSRGLAKKKDEYFKLLSGADQQRDNDLDGRGNLSQKALIDICHFFLDVALDQMEFMTNLLDYEGLEKRFKYLMRDWGLNENNAYVLSRIFILGEISKGEFGKLHPDFKERRARQELRALEDKGLIISEGVKDPIRLSYPIDSLEVLMPRILGAT
jgi:Fic family protein